MKRIDEYLFEKGLAPSRAKARSLIEEGAVFCNGKVVDKPSRKFADDADIQIKENSASLKYVSRGGLKLEKILDFCELKVEGFSALDAGASTGGFSDCLLQRGVDSVLCVDIGSGQLHKTLLDNPKATNLEKFDVRDLTLENAPNSPFDIIVGDLSFISLEKVLDVLWGLLKVGGYLLVLVKPQFETDKALIRRSKGILRDEEKRLECLEKIKSFVLENLSGAEILAVCESPILGGDGNKEFLIGVKKS